MKRESPLVSVILSTYKKFEYVYDTIHSVLMQDYPNIEFIITDDGSDNFPQEGIEKFVNENKRDNIRNFTILRSEVNIGIVKIVNWAYKYASGEIIVPLAGDDELYNEVVVSKIVREFSKRKCDVAVAVRVVCDENLKPLYYLPHIIDKRFKARYDSARKQYIAHITDRFYGYASGSVLYVRKKKWEELGGFDENYRLLEDTPFFAKYLWENKLEILYDVRAIKYRLGGVSTGGINPLMKKDFVRYNEVDRKRHIDRLDAKTKRFIRYTEAFKDSTSLLSRIKVYLKNPVVFSSNLVYKVCDKIKILYDKRMIKRGL